MCISPRLSHQVSRGNRRPRPYGGNQHSYKHRAEVPRGKVVISPIPEGGLGTPPAALAASPRVSLALESPSISSRVPRGPLTLSPQSSALPGEAKHRHRVSMVPSAFGPEGANSRTKEGASRELRSGAEARKGGPPSGVGQHAHLACLGNAGRGWGAVMGRTAESRQNLPNLELPRGSGAQEKQPG